MPGTNALARRRENPDPDPDQQPMSWGHAWAYGALWLAAGGGAGAGIGAVTNPPCQEHPTEFLGNLFCGPGWGAAFGGSMGVLVAGAVGGVTALVSEKYRRPGIVSAGVVATLLTLGLAGSAVRQSQRQQQGTGLGAAPIRVAMGIQQLSPMVARRA